MSNDDIQYKKIYVTLPGFCNEDCDQFEIREDIQEFFSNDLRVLKYYSYRCANEKLCKNLRREIKDG